MPLIPNTKQPLFPHKDGQHTWEKAESTESDDWGLCLRTMVVIDFDGDIFFKSWSKEFPDDFDTCPLVKTKKGYHAYFKRLTEYDDYGIFDRSRFMGAGGDDVDIKTICTTGTSGIISIPPSKNKTYERDFKNHPLQPLSDKLLKFISEKWCRKTITKKFEKNYEFEIVENPNINSISNQIIKNISVICTLLSKERATDYKKWIENWNLS